MPRKAIVLSLRVAPADNLAWRSAARRAGVPLSQFVRMAVNDKLRMHTPPQRMSLEQPPGADVELLRYVGKVPRSGTSDG